MNNLRSNRHLMPGHAHDSWRLDESVTHVQESAEEKQLRADLKKDLAKAIKANLSQISKLDPEDRKSWVRLYGEMHRIVGEMIHRDAKYAALKNYNDRRIDTVIVQVSKKALSDDALANLAKWKIGKLRWT